MRRFFLILLSLTLLTTGVSLAQTAQKIDDMLVYSLDEGQCILTVELVGNATTGYEWFCGLSVENLLTQVSHEYVPDEASAGLAGAGGKSVFVFETAMKDAGMATLAFDYKRSWEDQIETQYVMHVWVNEAGTLSVEDAYRKLPFSWKEGDTIACPQCHADGAKVLEIIDGGDEESGVVWMVEIECPSCGKVDIMV